MKHTLILILTLGFILPFSFVSAEDSKVSPHDPVVTPENILKGVGAPSPFIETPDNRGGLGDALRNFVEKRQEGVKKIIDEKKNDMEKLRDEKIHELNNVREKQQQKIEETKKEFRKNVTSVDRARLLIQNNPEIVREFQAKRNELQKEFEKRKEEMHQAIIQKQEEARKTFEERKQELQRNLQKIKDDKKIERAKHIFDQFDIIKNKNIERLRILFTNLDSILQRVRTRAEKASAHGVDISNVFSLIDTAQQGIIDGRALVESEAGKTYSVSISSEETIKSDFEKTRDELKNDIEKIQNNLKSIHEMIKNAVEALAKIPNVNELEIQSTSTITN